MGIVAPTQLFDSGLRASMVPYADGGEHVRHALVRVDALLRREVAQRTRQGAADYLSFAAITDAEITQLLEGAPPPVAATACDARIAELERSIEQRVAATLASGRRLPLIELAQVFGLTGVEIDVLLACLAVEVDRKYERVYGYLHDDLTRKLPSVALLLALCVPATQRLQARSAIFARQSPLLRYQLLHLGEEGSGQPFAARALRIDERILAFLLGVPLADARLHAGLVAVDSAQRLSLSEAQRQLRDSLSAAITAARQRTPRRKPLVYVQGSAASAVDDAVGAAAQAVELPLLRVDAVQLASSPEGFAAGLFLALREALLCQAALHVQGIDRVLEQDRNLPLALRSLAELAGVVFLSGERSWSWGVPPEPLALLPVELGESEFGEQIALWRTLLQESVLSDSELHELASTHPMAPADIAATVLLAQSQAALRGAECIAAEDLQRACRTRARPNLSGIARRVTCRYGWHDIVLPTVPLGQLRTLCSQAKHRSLVFGEWGFEQKLSLGKGLNALFAGPPGTGKTMAAEVIAQDLGLELYKIDLSQVVSKYIGDTEKNLHRIFEQAAQAHAILLFDEADALLGKRSAVKDAHDRYANTEIAYLLQKMEEYEGLTILTTNLRQNMDDAFIRRMRFVVEFPFPDEAARAGIWERAWPAAVPVSPDIDAAALARRFKLAGGSIRNITLAAAFLAAERSQAVDMELLIEAARHELRKMGRLVEDVTVAAPRGLP